MSGCQFCDHGYLGVTVADARAALGLTDGQPVPDERHAAYRAELNAVLPCRYCRPESWQKWNDGCLASGHQPCDRCRS